MKRFFAMFCFVMMMVSAVSAFADPGRVYVGGGLGVASLMDSNLTDSDEWGSVDYKATHDLGEIFNLAVGYDWGAYRVEAEVAYQQNDFHKEHLDGVSDLDGNVTSTAYMLNGYYEFLSKCSCLRPFVTAGLGFATVAVDDYKYLGVEDMEAGIDDDDLVFAYQIGAGVSYDVTSNIVLDLKYRYFATEDAKFKGTWGGYENTEMEYASHNVLFGARYKF